MISLLRFLLDRLAVVRLRRAIIYQKARNFDGLAENVIGLRRAIDTQVRQSDELECQLHERDAEIERLRQEYAALEARQYTSETASMRDMHLDMFKRLQGIATHLPTMQAALGEGADIRAQDVLALIKPLDQMLADLGFEMIGSAGQETSFDPTRHRAVGNGAQSINPNDKVRVRFVGYLYSGEVVCKAEVTPVKQAESVS
jgi:molecular chaperone GrpE (heat shock protein)